MAVFGVGGARLRRLGDGVRVGDGVCMYVGAWDGMGWRVCEMFAMYCSSPALLALKCRVRGAHCVAKSLPDKL